MKLGTPNNILTLEWHSYLTFAVVTGAKEAEVVTLLDCKKKTLIWTGKWISAVVTSTTGGSIKNGEGKTLDLTLSSKILCLQIMYMQACNPGELLCNGNGITPTGLCGSYTVLQPLAFSPLLLVYLMVFSMWRYLAGCPLPGCLPSFAAKLGPILIGLAVLPAHLPLYLSSSLLIGPASSSSSLPLVPPPTFWLDRRWTHPPIRGWQWHTWGLYKVSSLTLHSSCDSVWAACHCNVLSC